MGEVHPFKPHHLNARRPQNRRPQQLDWSRLLTAACGLLMAGLLALEFGFPLVGCNVKGNITPATGERIFHVPGQEYYSQTRISWINGERWFCSEENARQAGWRKAIR